MRSLYFREKGPAENVLEYGDRNIPDLLEGEVRVKMLASPINPADLMFIEKTYRVQPVYPQIAGFEGAGIIVNNGGANDYPINTLVAFRHKNAWAEFVNVPQNKIISLPANMPVEKAAQLSLNPLTAWALLDELNVTAGEWILLSAGNSAVSKLIIQFAKSRQVKSIAIVREADQYEEIIKLGASAVVRSNDNTLERQIIELVNNEKIAGFLDAVGGELASKIIKIITAKSKIIHYGLFSEQNVTYHNTDIIFKNLIIKGFGIDGWMDTKTAAYLERTWEQIIQEIMKPDFKMDIRGWYGLEEFKEAIFESKKVKNGKVLFWMR